MAFGCLAASRRCYSEQVRGAERPQSCFAPPRGRAGAPCGCGRHRSAPALPPVHPRVKPTRAQGKFRRNAASISTGPAMRRLALSFSRLHGASFGRDAEALLRGLPAITMKRQPAALYLSSGVTSGEKSLEFRRAESRRCNGQGAAGWIRLARRSRRGHHHRERARPGVRLRPEEDPAGERRRLASCSASARTRSSSSRSRASSARRRLRSSRPPCARSSSEGVTRDAVLNPRSARGRGDPDHPERIARPRDADGKVIGAIGILRDMRELDKARAYAAAADRRTRPTRCSSPTSKGKIIQANDAVFPAARLPPGRGRRAVALALHQPGGDARVHGARWTRSVERGVTRNAVLNPRSAAGEVIPTSLNASALRDADGKVIGAIGILRDMRELDKARAYAQRLIDERPRPGVRLRPRGQDPPGQRRRSPSCSASARTRSSSSRCRASSAPRRRASSPPRLREVVERGVTRNARAEPALPLPAR